MTQASNPFADASRFPMVREVPYIGVAWTVDQASKKGYRGGAADWVNFGQGQPEIVDIPGAPQRIRTAHAEPQDAEYGPIGGLLATREAVADWVNRTWRRGKMPYTAENVSFAAGGRLALTRLSAFSATALESGTAIPTTRPTRIIFTRSAAAARSLSFARAPKTGSSLKRAPLKLS